MSKDEEEYTTTITHSTHDDDSSVQGRFYIGHVAFSVYAELAAQLRQRGWSRTHSVTYCDLLLGDRFHVPYSTLRCEAPLPVSSIFHGVRWVHYFKGSHILTLKASMARLLHANTNACPPWLPLTFVLGGDQSKRVDDRNALCNAAQEERGDALWIVKPSSGAKGEGIVLLRGAHDIKAFVDSLDEESHAIYVVQRYVERPLLLSHGRKFDIRFWVLLMSPYTIYVFSQASCRTASATFDPSDLTNTAAHLTNHCVQEGVVGFGQYESGNEMWLDALRDYLLTLSGLSSDDNIMERVVLPQAKTIIVETLLAIRPELELLGDEPYSCFQLFGYDIMLGDQLRMYLLEINGSPGVANKYLSVLTRRVIDLLHDAEDSAEKVARVWDITKEEFVLLWSPSDTTKDA